MTDNNERLAVVETRIENLETIINQRLISTEKTVKEMNDVIQQLKGAKYVGWFIAAAFGYLIHTLLPFLQGKH